MTRFGAAPEFPGSVTAYVCDVDARFTIPTLTRKLSAFTPPPTENSAAVDPLNRPFIATAGRLCDVVPFVPGCKVQMRELAQSSAVGSGAPLLVTPVTMMDPRPDFARISATKSVDRSARCAASEIVVEEVADAPCGSHCRRTF